MPPLRRDVAEGGIARALDAPDGRFGVLAAGGEGFRGLGPGEIEDGGWGARGGGLVRGVGA